ncbi:SGNH/GDSL hydrolase family protein [Klebsiella variicola]|uniref:SGNH/GDSL hydrolase family protein n=1 Tax=Klebsiella variicola TaxID=244366 RepID=UPI000A8E47E2|nr:SGNH/GDSL hydrolase family protein [Klebsiella variicola]
MSNLQETAVWVDGIYQLTDETPVLGKQDDVPGDGPSNLQAQQLANRTKWLRLQLESASDYREYTFYKTENDPDGTIAGLQNTPDGLFFRVADGPDDLTSFTYYLNKSGVAIIFAIMPGQGAITGTTREFPTKDTANKNVAANTILNQARLWITNPSNFTLSDEYINNEGIVEPTGRSMPSNWTLGGVKFFRGYGNDEFEIIGKDFQKLDFGRDRMAEAGSNIKFGYGDKPLYLLGQDNQMLSFLTTDSLQDAGVSILRGYAPSPFVILGSDNQLLTMGSSSNQTASELPEVGMLDYLIAMQERAYTGGHLVIMCGPGDSLDAGTGGLGAIDAMYSLFAARLGHGGIGYFAPSNDNTASRDLLNMELVYSGWVDNQTYGKKCGPLNFALVPWSGRTNLFFRVKDASRSNPIYQHDVVEVGFTGTGDAGTSSQFRFRATDRNDDGSIGPAGSGEWQTATITNQPEGSEEIQIVRVEGLGPASGRFSLEIEPPATKNGQPALISLNCINSAGGVRVIRYARGGATAAYHLNQTASYQKYWMQYFAPDLVFINLGENDYALTDSEFLSGYSAIVERVQDALPGVPVFLKRWYSDNHIKRDAVFDVIQAKYGMLGFNVRDLIRNSNFAFQNGYAYSTTNPADPHPNARGARIIGAYQAKRALLNYAVQSLRKEQQNG